MNDKVKIGLALGAGATRGMAHIGVLQVMEELGVRPDFIAGSSIGSLVGALYAAGVSPKMMEGIAQNLDAKLCYDIGIPRKGFIRGKKLEDLIRLMTRNKSFEDLDIPLAITAVDLIKGERVIIKEGNVAQAVRASISIPGVFQPVYKGDKVLVDGGILERIPVGTVGEMGADFIIGVDVGSRGDHRPSTNIIEIIIQSFDVMQKEIAENNTIKDAVMVIPEINLENPLGFDQVGETIEAGRIAAMDVLGKLKEITTG
ncbi:MAG TPA: patatin-like phospholipase family protein [Bacillota bacterium]|nr:patatin-like phospholipase family protein [Bacillota bacterium]